MKWINKYLFSFCFLLFFNQITFALSTAAAPFSQTELQTIKSYLFKNIIDETNSFTKKDGEVVIKAIPGAVLASPANKGENFSQDYQFHWTRDAAITMQEVLKLYETATGEEKERLKKYLLNYVAFENKAQRQSSRKGEETLGQPKFNLDGSVWEGKWMRPQNDGPALRAITLIAIANQLLADNDKYVRDTLAPMIILDLDYVSGNWSEPSFDLWEEVNDRDHFFTKMVQRKALIEGNKLLTKLGDDDPQVKEYLNVAQAISVSLEKHWSKNRGYFAETVEQQFFKGGGINSAIILGVLLGATNELNDEYALSNDKIMSSVFFIRNAFANLYKVNLHQQVLLIGRYPNDIYDGDKFIDGNPWILTTTALAEYYYRLASILLKEGKIVVTKNNIDFFHQLSANIKLKPSVITVQDNSTQFVQLIMALMQEGDLIMQNVKRFSLCYTPENCQHYAEQINRRSGKQLSAKDLTWGYTSLLTAMQAREQVTSALLAVNNQTTVRKGAAYA